MKTHLPQLKTAMTPFPYSVDIESTMAEAREILSAHDFHHLPVTQDGQVIGIVHAEDLADAGHAPVRVHYRGSPFIVDIETPLAEVLDALIERRVDAAVVMRHGKLAGVFTTTDACRAFAALLHELAPPPGDDLVA